MRGVYERLLFDWDGSFIHENHGNPLKIARYNIGTNRFQTLKKYSVPFAFAEKNTKNSGLEIEVAYINILDEGDEDPGMAPGTKYEYIVGKEMESGKVIFFSYIWFEKIEDAKDFAKSREMKILSGWGS